MSVKKFTQYTKINENYSKDNFLQEIETLYHNINVINILSDEGYLEDISIKDDVTVDGLNEILKIHNSGKEFESLADYYSFLKETLEQMGDISKKYLPTL